MALSACKVPINEGMRADMDSLDCRTRTFEQMTQMPGFAAVPQSQRAGFFQRAIDIDQSVIPRVQQAIADYDQLMQDMGEAIEDE